MNKAEQIELGTCPTCGGPVQIIAKQYRHIHMPPVDSVGELTRRAVRGSLRREPKKLKEGGK
jgi:hypothetical protein